MMPQKLKMIVQFLENFAPLELAEDWDNVGLLLGDETAVVSRVMTCLTLTPDVAAEAIEADVDLIVTHHPVLFRPIKKLTACDAEGRMLITLLTQGVAVYSPHTAFDSARSGINQRIAENLNLTSIASIRPIDHEKLPSDAGSGRYGKLKKSIPLEKLIERVKEVLNIFQLQFVGDLNQKISSVGIACGSAAEYLHDAHRLGCDVLLTGEGRFHGFLEARELGTALILAGHYATERPAVEELAAVLMKSKLGIAAFASSVETDPINWSVS